MQTLTFPRSAGPSPATLAPRIDLPDQGRYLWPLLTVLLAASAALEAGPPSGAGFATRDQYAWSENAGWLNLKATAGNARVYADHLEGYAWHENLGWVRLGSFTGGGSHTYANTSATDYGVNRNPSTYALSGYAWSETVGWLNFASSNGGGVTADVATGAISGYAWAENVGWVRFAPYNVAAQPCGPGAALTTGLGATWKQLALPCVPTTATVQGALGSGATGNLLAADYNSGTTNLNNKTHWWRLFHYNASGSPPGYVLPAIGGDVFTGTGYWLKSFDAPVGGGNLTVTGTATAPDVDQSGGCASANGCQAVSLTVAANRYNLVGNPFPYHVDWSKVRIRVGGAGGTVYTPTAAENAGVLSKQIWIWNGNTYQTWDDVTQPGNLQYFQSFWVKVLPGAAGKNLELLIPAEMSPQSRLDADPARALAVAPLPWYLGWLDWVAPPARAADSEWQVRLGVENRVTGWQDTTNLLGQKLTAQTGYDRHDLIGLAPFATPYLSLVFPHTEWPATADGQKRAGDYDTDFRPAQGNPPTDWSFELRGSPTGGKVFITWQGDPAILKRSRLVDLQTGLSIDPTNKAYAQGYPVALRQKVQRYQWRFPGR